MDETMTQTFIEPVAVEVNRYWKCPNGHALGIVVREKILSDAEGKKVIHFVDRLLKFRRAMDLSVEPLVFSEIDCKIEGTVFDIACDVAGCGAVRTWHMGESALERVLAKVTK